MSGSHELKLDVLVIGGGPAGSACATRLAAGGSRVALVEATDYSGFRIGEIIAASTRPYLSRLGLEGPETSSWAAPFSGLAAAWGQETATKRPSLFDPYGSGLRIDRRAFDLALFRQAEAAGAICLTTTRATSTRREHDAWRFTLQSATGLRPGRSEWIVSATGRSTSAKHVPANARLFLDRLVAITLLRERDENQRDTRSDGLVEATESGWWYSVTTPNGSTLVIFFTDADLLPKGRTGLADFLARQLRTSPLTCQSRNCVSSLINSRRWVGFDARSSIQRLAVGDGWVAVGDAMMAFDPLCGGGIREAVSSGFEAAEWLLGGSVAEEDNGIPAFAVKRAKLCNDYALQRLAVYGEEERWIRSPFWQRRRLDS